jgi:hypothetical protein
MSDAARPSFSRRRARFARYASARLISSFRRKSRARRDASTTFMAACGWSSKPKQRLMSMRYAETFARTPDA